MLIKDIKKEERPRERGLLYGLSSLSNEDLLAIIIKTGTRNRSSRELALDILNSLDNIENMKDLTINKLLNIKGIGKTKALEIMSSIELGKRIYQQKLSNIKIKYHSSDDIFNDCKNIFIDKFQECFYCLYLNNKNELIERKLLFMGTINKSIVHPREVFKNAYLLSASKIVCLHNHPSGDVTPSKEDIHLTQALVEIGKLQSIPVLDHLIFGKDKYFSFSDNGLI